MCFDLGSGIQATTIEGRNAEREERPDEEAKTQLLDELQHNVVKHLQDLHPNPCTEKESHNE